MNEIPVVQPKPPVEALSGGEPTPLEEFSGKAVVSTAPPVAELEMSAMAMAGAEVDLAKIHGIEDALGVQLPQAVGEKEGLMNDAVETQDMHPLQNEREAERILLQGTADELEALREFHHLTSEQVKLFSHFVRLREDTVALKRNRFRERVMSAPDPNEEEWALGVYLEEIEPQVRDAVLTLRKKGYNTMESGFYGPEKQRIGFSEPIHLEISPEAVKYLEGLGLRAEVTEDGIELYYSKPLTIDELKDAWDTVARDLPNLNIKAGTATTGAAESFRTRVENIKRNPAAFFD